jgi:hypothetical protein
MSASPASPTVTPGAVWDQKFEGGTPPLDPPPVKRVWPVACARVGREREPLETASVLDVCACGDLDVDALCCLCLCLRSWTWGLASACAALCLLCLSCSDRLARSWHVNNH